jgi:serine phosphatase RsbU (regulator of sigma subunit)
VSASGNTESRIVDEIDLLAQNDIFQGLDRGDIESIVPQLVAIDLDRGSILFQEGDLGDAAYFVRAGRVHLETGGVRIVSRGRGECVGEFALLDGEPRSATAVAGSDVGLLRWDRESFLAAMSRNPRLSSRLVRLLTTKLRENVDAQVEYARERERWQLELEWAREIQSGMLPAQDAVLGSVEIAGHCKSARHVGGDFFYYFDTGAPGIGVAIGDVTGHGFYSALFVAMAKVCFQTQIELDPEPAKMMQALRRTLDFSIGRLMLMSGSYVLLDCAGKTLSYANAGHPPPIHIRTRGEEPVGHRGNGSDLEPTKLELLQPIDPLLGALPIDSSTYGSATRSWEPGDVIVMYSDGIAESRNARGELFGALRVEQTAMAFAGSSAGDIRDAILGTLRSFQTKRSVAADDETLVVMRYCDARQG